MRLGARAWDLARGRRFAHPIPVRHLFSLTLATLALTGCYRSTTRDGDTPGADAAIVLPDGSIARDGSILRPDAGRIDAGRDAGRLVGCEREIVPPYDGPVCPPEVSECIESCAGSDECPNECIGADPECTRCFYSVLIGCANELGCQSDWNTFACCSESDPRCAGAIGVERLGCTDTCSTEIDTYSECLNRIAIMECLQRASITCDLRI